MYILTDNEKENKKHLYTVIKRQPCWVKEISVKNKIKTGEFHYINKS